MFSDCRAGQPADEHQSHSDGGKQPSNLDVFCSVNLRNLFLDQVIALV